MRKIGNSRRIAIAILASLTATLILAGEKYPLTMTAAYTEGKNKKSTRTTYHSGDYDCTPGDENNAPTCRTLLEWAEIDRMGGAPDVVVFTLEDGSRVGIQSPSINKITDYVECSISARVVFCSLYFQMLEATQASTERPAKYGQTVRLSADEYMAEIKATHDKFFGANNSMTASFRYRLKGKIEKDGFQRIEVDPRACPTCNLDRLTNPRGDGYYKR